MKPIVSYAGPQDVVEILKQGQPMKDWAVIDVRDDDFVGGNIVGALNVPSQELLGDKRVMKRLVNQLEGVDTASTFKRLNSLLYLNRSTQVIVHCALSQIRGPKCANAIAEAIGEGRNSLSVTTASSKQRIGPNVTEPPELSGPTNVADGESKPRILILRGGFTRFQQTFRNDPKLVEKWDKLVWDPFN